MCWSCRRSRNWSRSRTGGERVAPRRCPRVEQLEEHAEAEEGLGLVSRGGQRRCLEGPGEGREEGALADSGGPFDEDGLGVSASRLHVSGVEEGELIRASDERMRTHLPPPGADV